MKRLLGVGALACSIALVGCGNDQNQTPYEQNAITADTSEGYGSVAPAPVTPTQGPETAVNPQHNAAGTGPLTATGNLTDATKNAPRGTVTVTQVGSGTAILVKLDHFPPSTHAKALLADEPCHPGDQAGTPVAGTIVVSDQGFATVGDTVPTPTAQLLNGSYSIRITTPSESAPNALLACANLPDLGR